MPKLFQKGHALLEGAGLKTHAETKERDLAAEWAAGGYDKPVKRPDIIDRMELPKSWRKKTPRELGAGVKKGQKHRATLAIKAFMLGILDDPKYRRSLERRIKAGELPAVELFMLTKTLGKPTEEINITANVPLFSLPPAFAMREDDAIEADVVPLLLGPGDEKKEG